MLRRTLGFVVLLIAAMVALPTLALAASLGGVDAREWFTLGGDWLGWLTVLSTGLIGLAYVAGTGIMPSGATATELAAITRRAFVPHLVVQFGQSTPYLSAALSNAQTASGGISSVTVPVQGAALTSPQMTDYGGAFTAPSDLNGIQDAEFNLKVAVVPIAFLGMEGLVQMNAAVIPKIEAKMNDAGNGLATMLASQIWTNATDQTNLLDGLPLIRATTGTYGNINRTTASNAFWRGNVVTAQTGTPNPTRANVGVLIVSAMRANFGEKPTMGFCSPGTWALLAQDFMGLEQFVITPDSAFSDSTGGAQSGFDALKIMGVPIYMDPGMEDGAFYFLNHRYISFYIHEAGAFVFTGFASTIPNNVLGYTGVVVAVLEHICSRPAAVTYNSGFNFSTV